MKILNLYAGIGGNRKLWGDEHEITAVEIDKDIAKIYQDFFPNDKVIVGDAHKYLLKHYHEFDFIWSSPPCPTHSRFNYLNNTKVEKGITPKFPDMKLYEEILFLKHWFKGKWVIENVMSYYEPLIKPQIAGRHYFWANFHIPNFRIHIKIRNDRDRTLNVKMKEMDMKVKDFYGYNKDKRTLLDNCIEPNLGLKILNCGIKTKQQTVSDFFPTESIIEIKRESSGDSPKIFATQKSFV